MCYSDKTFEIEFYQNDDDSVPIQDWLRSFKDKTIKGRITARIDRLEDGNFGDCKPLKDGVWELRLHFGTGYRIYYSKIGSTIVLLLCGGDKRSQKNDVNKTTKYLSHYKRK